MSTPIFDAAVHDLLSALAGCDTHDVNLRDHPDAHAAVETFCAVLATFPATAAQVDAYMRGSSHATTNEAAAQADGWGPMTIAKAIQDGERAKPWIDGGESGKACVGLVGIQVQPWVHTPESAQTWSDAYNLGVTHARAAISRPVVEQTIPAAQAGQAQGEVRISVDRMVESVNGVSWWVRIRVGDCWQDIAKYSDRYRNRAEYQAARLRHLFGQADAPDIMAYPDPGEAPAPAVDRGLSEAPTLEPMPPTDDLQPGIVDGYLESTREWVDRNLAATRWFHDNHAAIRVALAASAPSQAEPQWTALPYASPIELWKAFKAGTKFALHYHGKTFDVTHMEPREHVVYVQPPGMPVKVYPDGRNCETAGDAIWLEQIATTPSQAGSCQASGNEGEKR